MFGGAVSADGSPGVFRTPRLLPAIAPKGWPGPLGEVKVWFGPKARRSIQRRTTMAAPKNWSGRHLGSARGCSCCVFCLISRLTHTSLSKKSCFDALFEESVETSDVLLLLSKAEVRTKSEHGFSMLTSSFASQHDHGARVVSMNASVTPRSKIVVRSLDRVRVGTYGWQQD